MKEGEKRLSCKWSVHSVNPSRGSCCVPHFEDWLTCNCFPFLGNRFFHSNPPPPPPRPHLCFKALTIGLLTFHFASNTFFIIYVVVVTFCYSTTFCSITGIVFHKAAFNVTAIRKSAFLLLLHVELLS